MQQAVRDAPAGYNIQRRPPPVLADAWLAVGASPMAACQACLDRGGGRILGVWPTNQQSRLNRLSPGLSGSVGTCITKVELAAGLELLKLRAVRRQLHRRPSGSAMNQASCS
jgi:hypothetical protein